MARDPLKMVSYLVYGMNSCRLYPADHPAITEHIVEARKLLAANLDDNVMHVCCEEDGSVQVNGRAVLLETPEAKKFSAKLRHKEVHRIVISKEVTVAELKQLLMGLSASGGALASSDNIAVTLQRQHAGTPVAEANGLREEIYSIRQVIRDLQAIRSINHASVDAIVGGMIVDIRKKDVLQMLVPMQGGSDDLFIHSANVAILSIFQAENLGFGTGLLHDIGFAAIFHDIGKTLVPKKVIERQNSLNEEGWGIMRQHPVYGAAFLASLEKVPDSAIVVAFEHHMNYDGSGYPDTRQRGKKQHVLSQIVAIADFFCALRADFPHRKTLDFPAITGLFIKAAGKEFNPLLVENFVYSLRTQRSAVSWKDSGTEAPG